MTNTNDVRNKPRDANRSMVTATLHPLSISLLATTGSTKVFPATNPELDSACSMSPNSQPLLPATAANP